MRRLAVLLAAITTALPITPARADTVIDIGVYVNGQATGWCEDFSGRLPDGGPAVCHFPVPAPPVPTIQALAMDATFKLGKPVRGYLSFVMGDGSTTAPLTFCENQTFPVPAGAQNVLMRVASVTDIASTDPCTFGTAGYLSAVFDR
jgi:hypothetical protein